MAQMVKNLPAMQETQVLPLGWEDPLEKEMAPHSSILAWEIPWTEEPGRLQSLGSQRVGRDLVTEVVTAKQWSLGLVELWASLLALMVKNPSTMWETQVRSLGREDPLEKEMAPHSSILAWEIP